MKFRLTTSNLLGLLALAVAGMFLSGCAEMASGNTKSLLSAAGFHMKTPQTPMQKEIYAQLTPYHVERATVPGKGVFYVYKDEDAGVAYVGREQEYQNYCRLAVQQRVAQDQIMAANMNAMYARRWYGAYGYW
jgi:hypothetical protein